MQPTKKVINKFWASSWLSYKKASDIRWVLLAYSRRYRNNSDPHNILRAALYSSLPNNVTPLKKIVFHNYTNDNDPAKYVLYSNIHFDIHNVQWKGSCFNFYFREQNGSTSHFKSLFHFHEWLFRENSKAVVMQV